MSSTIQDVNPETGPCTPETSRDDLFDVCLKSLSSTSYNVRKSTLDHLSKLIDEFIKDDTERDMYLILVKVLFSACNTWVDNRSRKLLDAFVEQVASKYGNTFVTPFLIEYSKILKHSKVRIITIVERYIRFGVLAISAGSTNTDFPLDFTTDTVLVNFVKELVRLVQIVFTNPDTSAQDRVIMSLALLFSKSSVVTAEYLKQVKGVKSFGASVSSVSACFKALNYGYKNIELQKGTISAWNSIRVTVLKQYNEEVSSSPTTVKQELIDLFALVAPLFTEEDLLADGTNAILPHIVRGLKRAPQVILSSLMVILSNISKDLLDAHIKDILPPIMNELKHTNDVNRRLYAKNSFVALSTVCNEESLLLLLSTIENHVLGINGVSVITVLDTKLNAIETLAGMAKANKTEFVRTRVNNILLALLKKETIANNKDFILANVCTAQSNEGVDEEIATVLFDAVKAIDISGATLPYQQFLLALEHLYQSYSMKGLGAKFASAEGIQVLDKLVQYCVSHPSSHRIGVSVLLMALRSQVQRDTLTSVVKETIVHPFYASEHFLATSTEAELMQLLSITKLVFTHYSEVISGAVEADKTNFIENGSLDAGVLSFANIFQYLLVKSKVRKYAVEFLLRFVNTPTSSNVVDALLYSVLASMEKEEKALAEAPLPPPVVLTEEEEPLYIPSWDGSDSFLTVKRYVSKKHDFSDLKNIVTDNLPVTNQSCNIAQLLVNLSKCANVESLPLLTLVALHPFAGCSTTDIFGTMSVISELMESVGKSYVSLVSDEKYVKALLVQGLFGSRGWLVCQESRYKNRAAIQVLGYFAKYIPTVFVSLFVPKMLALLNQQDLFHLTPYEAAVFLTPTWKTCDEQDPQEEKKIVVGESKNIKLDKNSGYTKAELVEMQRKAEEEERGKALASASNARLAKQASIRVKVRGIVTPLTNTMIALEFICQLCPRLAHDSLLTNIFPLLHQYVLGLKLNSMRAGYSSSISTDFPKKPAMGEAPIVGVIALVRENARKVLYAFAKTLDLHITSSMNNVLVATDMVYAVWEHPADEAFGLVAKALAGNKAALKTASMDRNVNAIIALSKAQVYLHEQVEEFYPLTVPSFCFQLPTIDAVLKYSPSVVISHADDEEEDDTPAADDVEEESDIGVSNSAFITTLESTVTSMITSASTLVSLHCETAAQSSIFPTSVIIDLLLVALPKTTDGDASETLEEALTKLGPSLQSHHIEQLNSDNGIFSSSAVTRMAVLKTLGKSNLLVSANNLMLTAETEEEKRKACVAMDALAEVATKVYTLVHDRDANVAKLAKTIYDRLLLDQLYTVSKTVNIQIMVSRHVNLITHPSFEVRDAAGGAIASLVTLHASEPVLLEILNNMTILFEANKNYIVKKQSSRDTDKLIDLSHFRVAMSNAIGKSVKVANTSDKALLAFVKFFLYTVLSDNSKVVWNAGLDGFKRLIFVHGVTHAALIVQELQACLNNKEVISIPCRQGASLLLGICAHYTATGDITSVFNSLIKALETPSKDVQMAIAKELINLGQRLPGFEAAKAGQADAFFDTLINKLITSTKDSDYNVRSGSAFGLASIISILEGDALKRFRIQSIFSEQLQSKTNNHVHGALCVVEALYIILGQLMASSITHLVQLILPCYASGDINVRKQSEITINAMTQHLSHVGVRVLLPTLLSGLRDKSWRTKVESIQMLASLTSLPAKELTLCVPIAIAKLLEVVTDVNEKVAFAAKNALVQINNAVRNPEVRKIRPELLNAILNRTAEANKDVINLMHTTVFHHYVDPIALALIIPIVRTCLKERDSMIRRNSIQILGTLPNLVASHDELAPYTDGITRQLKSMLMDSLPDIRRTTAKAIGSMACGSLASHFTDLLQLLLDILTQKEVRVPANTDQLVWANYGTTSAQRSGSALGSAQMLLGQGLDYTDNIIDTVIVPSLTDKRDQVREGFIMLLHTLPEAFGLSYGPLLIKTFPLILGALSDSYAVCRELAVKAGQQLVINFAISQTEVIYASLMEALIDEDYRVRQGALQLSANLLLRIAGKSGEIVFADLEDTNGILPQTAIREHSALTTEIEENLVIDRMGQEQRDEFMTSIYILRSDVMEHVSSIAWRVWKATVPSTGRMLQKILPRLIERITSDLASWNVSRQQTSANALNELVNKLGDRILRDIIPLLLDNLTSPDVHTRKGVCLGLAEIASAATKSMMTNYLPDFIPSIANALCDVHPDVRQAARAAYNATLQTCGERVVRETMALLLETIDVRHSAYMKLLAMLDTDNKSHEKENEKDTADYAIEGLKLAVSIHLHDRIALELIIQHLLGGAHITPFHIGVLSKISSACSKSFILHIGHVLQCLQTALYTVYRDLQSFSEEEFDLIAESQKEEEDLFQSVINVVKGLGVDVQSKVLDILLQTIRSAENHSNLTYVASIRMNEAFWKAAVVEENTFNTLLMNDTLGLYFDILAAEEEETLQVIAGTLDALLTAFHPDLMVAYIGFIRSKFNDLTGKKKNGSREISEITGLGYKNMLSTMLVVFQHGLLTGSKNVRMQASAGLSDLAELAPVDALTPHVMRLTGFLIRSFGDRLPVEVRAHILNSLIFLMQKCSNALKPFQSQLKTSMLRALHDESHIICERAAATLVTLPNPAGYVMELYNGASKQFTADAGGKMLKCITSVFINTSVMPEELCVNLLGELLPNFHNVELFDSVRVESARIAALVLNHVNQALVDKTMKTMLHDAGIGSSVSPTWVTRQSIAMFFSSVLAHAKEHFELVGYKPAIAFIARGFKDDNDNSCTAALRFAGRLLIYAADKEDDNIVKMLTQELLSLAQPLRVAENIAICALEQVRKFGEQCPENLTDNINIVVALCVRCRTGASKGIRKEIDNILYYALSFHEGNDEGMENAEEIAKNFSEADATEFISLCKRSVSKIKSQD